ncbi:hypothetical protein GTA62_18465 [Roseobacter sp. HKCCD9010]|uniref:hypothetical protein n=2 Tax=unclassified Roseobacter TaxID=196798 RepID=UPI001492E196|nr:MULTISPECIES: hypothetical protein [unclassified Roseobacter]MBF9051903.1 hypothetical protein [Rhodobacterales bacterium HKCCD4356]NNV40305.1 hypothetical protein [Roseobacter sp. HKCCD9054]NNV78639.1 hypothetical protein [Roseobacter sp. HKCCD6135]NNW08426.1 hypothetical protein [Roseobacter sp. HKCCD8431]NNW25478.1 hypothetical protein [Roseobacter sp. HKCCD5929]NNW34047.1 hypothetical protein [Roseobacter sp. HKCCD8198]NNW51121.1 hypothetical protein [Roseobacter sp. HKCCD9144]NNW552
MRSTGQTFRVRMNGIHIFASVTALALCLGLGGAQATPGVTTDLLTFIRAHEAPRGYDDYERRIPIPPPHPLTQMTLAEVVAWQQHVRRAGAISTAAGGYQIIYGTLTGLIERHNLDVSARFDPAMQDRLARLLIAECGDPGPPAQHVRFGNCLAGIWAALPLLTGPNRGRSVYRGTAGNRALTSPEAVLAVIAGGPVVLPPVRAAVAQAPVPDSEVLAFGAIRLNRQDVRAAMRGAAQANSLTPSVHEWGFDPYAVD